MYEIFQLFLFFFFFKIAVKKVTLLILNVILSGVNGPADGLLCVFMRSLRCLVWSWLAVSFPVTGTSGRWPSGGCHMT